ncbi:MAG TPA: hypothetical protein VII38_04625 [Polyangia bacterium]|jgi:hypothetical protein
MGSGPHTGSWRTETPAIHVSDAIHVNATWHELLLVCWRQSPTLAALDDVHEATRRLLVAHPEGVGVLGIAQSGMPMIGAAERGRAADLLKDFGKKMRCLASVIEGEGFWAGTTRSVMTAITLMARPPCPTRIFSTVSDAAGWMAPSLGAPATSALSIERAVVAMRRQADSSPPA